MIKFIDKMNEVGNEVLNWLRSGLKYETSDYCSIETAIDDGTKGVDSMPIFALDNGGLLSIVQIDGLKTILSEKTYAENIINRLSSNLGSYFKKRGHYMQMVFEYDPVRANEILDELFADQYAACDKLGLDLKYIVDDDKRTLARTSMIADERNFMLLWTYPTLLSPNDVAIENVQRVEEFKEANLQFSGSANPFIANKGLINAHKSYVKFVQGELSAAQIGNQIVNLRHAAREMQSGLDRKGNNKDWNVRLAGDYTLPVNKGGSNLAQGWNVVPETVAKQVFSQEIDKVPQNSRIVKCGSLYFAPIRMTEPPVQVHFFHNLFAKLIANRSMGWRVMMSIGGDGYDAKKGTRAISAYIEFTSPRNRLYNDTIDSMKNYIDNLGMTAVEFRISACTWGNTLEEAERNVSDLMSAFKGWGSPTVTDVTGNPIEGLASASMGFTPTGISPSSAPPLADALAMMPFSRPARIWNKGSEIGTSPDGKPLVYQPLSSMQNAWTTFVAGSSGSGKSVSLNDSHISFILTTANDSLPYIAIIDYDRSSEGFCDLIQNALPESEQDKVRYIRLQNSSQYCINPFDTFKGARFMLEGQKLYATMLLMTALTEPSKQPPDGYLEFLRELIDRAEQYYSDCKRTFPFCRPREYSPNIPSLISVDNALREVGFQPLTASRIVEMQQEEEENASALSPTSWWEITDILNQHLSGKYKREAQLAQYQARPTLNDLIGIARTDTHIQNLYKDKLVNGEPIIEAFARSLTSVISRFPLISDTTKFNLGDARIVAIDTMDIVSGEGSIAEQTAAIVYAYATNALSSKFAVDVKSVINIPVPQSVTVQSYTNADYYKQEFIREFEALANTRKRLAIDEMRMPMRVPAMQTFFADYVLLMRKRNTESLFASQYIHHFPTGLLSAGTTFSMLSSLGEDDLNILKGVLGIEEIGELNTLKNIKSPKHGGAAVMMYITKSGRYAQSVRRNIGILKLWSLTTTPEDFHLMKKVRELVGGNSRLARELLARAFPNGSAKDEIELIKRNTDARSGKDIYLELAQKIIQKYKHLFA